MVESAQPRKLNPNRDGVTPSLMLIAVLYVLVSWVVSPAIPPLALKLTVYLFAVHDAVKVFAAVMAGVVAPAVWELEPQFASV